MEIIEIIAIVFFVVLIVAGIAIKRYTKRSLKDIDGMGEVSTQRDSKNTTRL